MMFLKDYSGNFDETLQDFFPWKVKIGIIVCSESCDLSLITKTVTSTDPDYSVSHKELTLIPLIRFIYE